MKFIITRINIISCQKTFHSTERDYESGFSLNMVKKLYTVVVCTNRIWSQKLISTFSIKFCYDVLPGLDYDDPIFYHSLELPGDRLYMT